MTESEAKNEVTSETAEVESIDNGTATASAATPAPEPEKDLLAEAKADIAKLRDQLLRTAADFDNYRKRSRRDVEDAQKKGAEEMLKTILPVFDNLERAGLHAEQAADVKAILEGVKMVIKQLTDTLARSGITRVPGLGTPFDPMVHEAVQQVETADAAPGTVIAEVQAGYKLGDRLMRAAMVVVAKAPAPKAVEPN